MANFVYNIAAGKVAEYAERVNANDPTNSAFVLVVINADGTDDAAMKDVDTLTALLALDANEVTNANYARKTLNQAGGITVTVDDANDRVEVDIPDQTFTDIAAGDPWTDLVICYDPDTTGGTDANIVPLVNLDFAVTPDGSSIVAEFDGDGFFNATT